MPAAEQDARSNIDQLLTVAGWSVQSVTAADIHAARGVALREFPLEAGYWLEVRDKARRTVSTDWRRDGTPF